MIIFGDDIKDISAATYSLPPSDLIARPASSFCRWRVKNFFFTSHGTKNLTKTLLLPLPTKLDSPTRRIGHQVWMPPGAITLSTRRRLACGWLLVWPTCSIQISIYTKATWNREYIFCSFFYFNFFIGDVVSLYIYMINSCLPTCLRDGALLDHESVSQDYGDTYVDTVIVTTVPCTVYHCPGKPAPSAFSASTSRDR
jgi:hypothetical protein